MATGAAERTLRDLPGFFGPTSASSDSGRSSVCERFVAHDLLRAPILPPGTSESESAAVQLSHDLLEL
jgi:hypothetical protein